MAEHIIKIPVPGKVLRAVNFLLGPTADEAPGFDKDTVLEYKRANLVDMLEAKIYKSVKDKLKSARRKGYKNLTKTLEIKIDKITRPKKEDAEFFLGSLAVVYPQEGEAYSRTVKELALARVAGDDDLMDHLESQLTRLTQEIEEKENRKLLETRGFIVTENGVRGTLFDINN